MTNFMIEPHILTSAGRARHAVWFRVARGDIRGRRLTRVKLRASLRIIC